MCAAAAGFVLGSLPNPAYPLRVEASHREFYRLQDALSDRSWVAMSSPPILENNEQFVALAKLFYGLGTPKLLAADQVNGFFLMEDLGSVHLSDAYLRDGADQTLSLIHI